MNQALAWFAGVALLAMMVIVVAEIFLRGMGRPLAGSFEIIGWLSAAAMALALGYVQLYRGHVAMTLVTALLKGRAAAALDALISAVSLVLFAIVAGYVLRYGVTLYETGSLSETLRVAVYPWVFLLGLGFFGLCLALLLDLVRSGLEALGL